VTHSIRTRLIVWVLVLLVPLAVLGAWLLVQVFGERLLRDIDVALEEEAETIAAVAAQASSPEALAEFVSRVAAETDLGGRKYITVSREGQVIAAAPDRAVAVLGSHAPGLRVARFEMKSADGPFAVAIAVAPTAALHARRGLTSLLLFGTPIVLILVGAGLWLVVGRTLRPLEEASRQLETMAADDLSARIPLRHADDEVGRMVLVLNRMLDRVERAVSELRSFTADAAHELRTPLTVLRAGLEVALSRERQAPEYRAALAEALAGTDRMCHLAEDLLTLARLEAAGTPRAAAGVDRGEMLRELADAWKERCDAAGAVLALSAPQRLETRGNAGDLYRLFNNLIENALRYGGRRIEIAARRSGAALEVTVEDDGPGIPPEDLPRVFDRFYRGRGARREGDGTGLGLSIAQEIARTHGGRIRMANRRGRGCVAMVTLRVGSEVAGGTGPEPDGE